MTGLKTAMPALFTSLSTRPNLAATWATPAWTCAGSRTSACTASTASGLSNAATVRCSVSLSMSSSAMRWPRARNHWPMARPMPRAPPVTMATGELAVRGADVLKVVSSDGACGSGGRRQPFFERHFERDAHGVGAGDERAAMHLAFGVGDDAGDGRAQRAVALLAHLARE